MFKALVCDIDNTLADGVSWYKITESLGASVQEHQAIFESYLAGDITYVESKDQLISLWQSGGKATRKQFAMLFENWQLRGGALELFEYARQRGWNTALITGSVDLFAETIACKLAVSHWYANTRLIWDQNGNLVDYDYEKDQSAVKLRQLEEFADKSRISVDECLVVGDGDNDLAMFEATGNGVAVGDANTPLMKAAWKHVGTLAEVRKVLTEL
jgi:HAD superfamily phosphoserine phosphatase-like hydrolase